MIWSATAGGFADLLLARLFLGVATAAAGPLIASLTGDYPRSSCSPCPRSGSPGRWHVCRNPPAGAAARDLPEMSPARAG